LVRTGMSYCATNTTGWKLTEYLGETDPRLMENLERRRRARTESERQVDGLEEERGRLEQEQRSDVEQERQRLVEDLERVKTQRQAEQQEEERVRLEREFQRSQSELEHRKRAAATGAINRLQAVPGGADLSWWPACSSGP
jgi:hypothetical protein